MFDLFVLCQLLIGLLMIIVGNNLRRKSAPPEPRKPIAPWRYAGGKCSTIVYISEFDEDQATQEQSIKA
jgi:hypothetical protein